MFGSHIRRLALVCVLCLAVLGGGITGSAAASQSPQAPPDASVGDSHGPPRPVTDWGTTGTEFIDNDSLAAQNRSATDENDSELSPPSPSQSVTSSPEFKTGFFSLLFGVVLAGRGRTVANYTERLDSIGSKTEWSEVEAAEWKVFVYRGLGAGLLLLGIGLIVQAVL